MQARAASFSDRIQRAKKRVYEERGRGRGDSDIAGIKVGVGVWVCMCVLGEGSRPGCPDNHVIYNYCF